MITVEKQMITQPPINPDFIPAVESASIEIIPTKFDPLAEANFSEQLLASKMALLGETHGVAENPAIIYTLMRHFGISGLGLEWSNPNTKPELKVAIDDYLEGKPLDQAALDDRQFGSMTAGHFALLKKLKADDNLQSLMLFNADGESWNDRDLAMAEEIFQQRDPATTALVACGNLHARTSEVNLDDLDGSQGLPKDSKPMGYSLSQKLGVIPTVRINYIKGEYNNMGKREFYTQPEIPQAKFYQNEDGTYSYDLPAAHSAVLP